MIKVGDRVPSATIRQVTDDGPKLVSTDEFFAGKKVALFAVPGAFTSTCSAKHLPSFSRNFAAFKAKHIDVIACISVNDAAVMKAWSVQSGTKEQVTMLSDGNGEFARAIGAVVDLSKNGMGWRSRRYSMLVDDGVVKQFYLEEPGAFGVSSGDHLLTRI